MLTTIFNRIYDYFYQRHNPYARNDIIICTLCAAPRSTLTHYYQLLNVSTNVLLCPPCAARHATKYLDCAWIMLDCTDNLIAVDDKAQSDEY